MAAGGSGKQEIPEAVAAAKTKDDFKAALRDTRMHVTHRQEDVRGWLAALPPAMPPGPALPPTHTHTHTRTNVTTLCRR